MENKETSPYEIVMYIMLFLIIIVSAIFMVRHQILDLIIVGVKFDITLGLYLKKLFGIYSNSDNLNILLNQIQTYKFDWGSFTLLFSRDNINYINFSDYIFKYFFLLNIALFAIFLIIQNYSLEFIRKLKAKELNNSKKENVPMNLYFCDDKLKFNRKTLKMNGKNVFAFKDYFLPYLDEMSDEFIDQFVKNSVVTSFSIINKNPIRYKAIEEVWNSILDKYKINGELPNIKKYQFKRFELISTSILDKNPLEYLIFDTKEEKYNGVNIWTSKNSNEIIKKYIINIHPYLLTDNDKEIDYTSTLLEDLRIYFNVKHYRGFKTFFFDKKNIREIKTPFLLLQIIDDNIEGKEKEEAQQKNFKIIKDSEKYFDNLKYLKYYLAEGDDLKYSQPVLPNMYVLTPQTSKFVNKVLGKSNLPQKINAVGLEIPINILDYYIRDGYTKEIREQIETLKRIGGEEALIEELKDRISQDNPETRISQITSLLKQHSFEETFLLGYWKYGLKLLNLPTGRLAILKKENIVFWYALTAIGRPFSYKASLPIAVIEALEIEMNTAVNKIKNKIQEKEIQEVIGEEQFNYIKKQSFNSFDEDIS